MAMKSTFPSLAVGDVHRTGWKEQDLLDNNDTKSLKGDIALHYRITDKME